jgi:sulfur carrier protein
MVLIVNGESRVVNGAQLNVIDILSLSNVESPELVSIQINGKFLGKEYYQTTLLKDNDEVDFLYFLGGGR